MFTDDQVIFAHSENDLQLATCLLCNITSEYNLVISSNGSKVMTFEGRHSGRSEVLINKIIEQVSHFNCQGCEVSYNYDVDLQTDLSKFQYMCGTIKKHILRNKTRKDTQIL
jgi:hypothetical protein